MKRKHFVNLSLLLLISYSTIAQTTKPKLVVGLVIDQMRWDYLYKFKDQYGAKGFNRLLKEGFTAENAMIPYTPTYTAPGHTCVYTGSVPATHGIVGNNWYDNQQKKFVYCTDDSTVTTVGATSRAGKMSPANMFANTITDELRLATNFKSKVIGIALKDRGAILPAGHSGNAAYWYDAGKWITSSYYMNELPKWVTDFNAKDEAGKAMKKDWTTLYDIKNYTLSTADDKPYENTIIGEKTRIFPHKLSAIADKDKYEAFKTTPWANDYTFHFAEEAIDKEKLGQGSVTDFLTVSISSTDYIGHAFGPNSIEIQDCYLRLDFAITEFLMYLDNMVGKGNYTLFLTADHGVAHVPGFMKENKIPAGEFDDANIAKMLNEKVEAKFAIKKAITTVMNYQVYVNTEAIEANNGDVEKINALIITELQKVPYITHAFELTELEEATLPQPQKNRMANGYLPQRSGQIQFVLKPGYFDGWGKGSSHGLWNPYDAHIPCIFYGWGVKPGKTHRETYMTDIAPTLAAILKIQMPNGCVGKVIEEVVK
jgi:predicted AlkP superfamily pyrophosphatase or phosphodiesterase